MLLFEIQNKNKLRPRLQFLRLLPTSDIFYFLCTYVPGTSIIFEPHRFILRFFFLILEFVGCRFDTYVGRSVVVVVAYD